MAEGLVIMLNMCSPMEKCTASKILWVTSEESGASKNRGAISDGIVDIIGIPLEDRKNRVGKYMKK